MTVSMNNKLFQAIQPKKIINAPNDVKSKENDLTDSQEQKITESGIPDETNSSRTKIPNNNAAPIFKGIQNKLIVEGNLKETIEKLDIMGDEKHLDKLVDMYLKDMDKCLLAETYKEYSTMVMCVNKKWSCFIEKINQSCTDENPEIASKANDIMSQKIVPLLSHFQEVFQVMDNKPVIQKGYKEILKS